MRASTHHSMGLRWIVSLLWIVAGCAETVPGGPPTRETLAPSHDDGEPHLCVSTVDCPFGTHCVGGICTDDPIEASDDGPCLEDDDCPDGYGCAPGSGWCVPLVEQVDPELVQALPCVDGAQRPCGIKVGECEYGSQVCDEGQWGECVGGIGPQSEICNGLDDDCDGLVSEVELDHDGDGIRACEGDCDDLDATVFEAAPEVCDGIDNDCDTYVDEETDALCDDGLYCTGVEACVDGACAAGSPPVCSGLDDVCLVGTCDELTDRCVPVAHVDNTPCDDEGFCTIGDACVAGVCVGSPRDCAGAGDGCNVGFCDEEQDHCGARPMLDGTACSDGTYCTVADRCVSGVCDGSPRDCSGSSDQCNAGVCNEVTQRCDAAPLVDDTPCNDGLFCSVTDRCVAGACAGMARDCGAAANSCNSGVCREDLDLCVGQPVADGTSCADDLFCTVNDRCTAGRCGGDSRDCSGEGDACRFGACDETSNVCAPLPLPDGTACDDGVYCTVSDACVGGSCGGGGLRDCAAATGGDPCYNGVCELTADSCVAVDNGTCDPCEDGRPMADAGADYEAVPNETVQLDGGNSTDPDGQSLSYSWWVESRPQGSTAELSNPVSMIPTILADVSGDFTICLGVTDQDACMSNPDCMTLTVKPRVDLHIELTWDTTATDLDLHYRAPAGFFFDSWISWDDYYWFGCGGNSSDAYWCSHNPDWGYASFGLPDGDAGNDPILDVDNVEGYGPENINQNGLFDNGQFSTVGVHFFGDYGGGTTVARIRIFVDGEAWIELTETLGPTDFWQAADIIVSDSGTSVAIFPLSGLISGVTEPSAHP